jgi:hypothetical protein
MTRKERDLAEKAIELTTYNQTIQSFNHNCGVAAARGSFYERYTAKYRTAKS